MVIDVYEWLVDAESAKRWIELDPEVRRKQVREAVRRYAERNKDNPEYKQRRLEQNRKSMKKQYRKRRANMTEEELDVHRAKTREAVRRYRARKKAEKELKAMEDRTIKACEIIDKGLYDAAIELMDDDIREDIHKDMAPCTDLEFLVEYMKRHKEKYRSEFTI